MTYSLSQQKNIIRERIRLNLSNQKEEDLQQKSCQIKEQLCACPEFKEAATIMSYVSIQGEVDTYGVIEEALTCGKIVAVPFVIVPEKKIVASHILSLTEDLSTGPYGIPQPEYNSLNTIDNNTLECVIVPGLAFTPSGDRLGRGAGYFDRFLATLPETTCAIGIAFDFQVVGQLPTGEHDQKVDFIITA